MRKALRKTLTGFNNMAFTTFTNGSLSYFEIAGIDFLIGQSTKRPTCLSK